VFQKDPDKQTAKEAARLEKQRSAEQAAEAKRVADAWAAFRASPRGQARTAREAGAGFFQYAAPLSETTRTVMAVLGGTSTASGQKRREISHTGVLSEIEAEGWRLEDVGYVFEQTGSTSRDKAFSSGQTATVNGRIVGVYLFRVAFDLGPASASEAPPRVDGV
jgi:hypothetical protein